ncbi:metal-dependent hydrolase family protein [Stackebrandtia nassauensis]|uniref:Amidohydrolase n=1 Tax=Stackebrandtia nassauensis (strain DSM 44728 / CIP 108903 / NRRL B-16338 / NBRC 102104 / LLR-40K-21) TaxID=446470 RepID=D3QBW3_STANL|nr:amidohydrolase family protein [Stackebrandtia nassauensis]ADD44852.1 amidohydrolase [Stackebrandtia nassauensis DSM 44728]
MGITITNAVIFDGTDFTEGGVRIIGGEIAEVGQVSVGEKVIDAAGRTLVPGLIDAHFHAYGISVHNLEFEAGPLSYLALKGARRLGRALRRGFTTVRDVAGGDIGLSRAITEGLIDSPRYLYTGPALSQTGGHGDARPADLDICLHGGHMNEVVDGVDALRTAVRERFRTGAHAIKLMTSGGVVSPTDPLTRPQYSAEEIAAVCAEAARRGSYVAAHAYSPEAIRHSIANGVRSIEHGNLLDDATATLMAEAGAYLVPTLIAYDAMDRRGDAIGLPAVSRSKNREVLDAGRHAVELAHAAGVAVGFGSDLMGDLEDDQLLGLRLQIEASSVLDTLRSATTVNAKLLRRTDLGVIRPGARGDLLLLDGDPVADPAVLWDESRPRTVIQGGAIAT